MAWESEILKIPRDRRIHLVGIKGTGMAALAEMLHHRGGLLSGSDGKDRFYTDEVLGKLGIDVQEEFSAANISPEIALVVYSTAYPRDSHPELRAADELGIPVISYPQALGLFSRMHESCGVSGIHGKTTTSALAGVLAGSVGLPATVLVGSQVPGFNDACTLTLGEKYFIAEACEYRGSFLNFHASHILITSIEHDHPDFFPTLEDVYSLFVAYAAKLPPGGTLLYNADDAGTCEVISRVLSLSKDLKLVPYGQKAGGDFRITEVKSRDGELAFSLAGLEGEFKLRIPGLHNVSNSAAALSLVCTLRIKESGVLTPADIAAMQQALWEFTGTRRRSELIGEAGGIIFLDDYGHHPTAIRSTLEGYRSFYPGRRLIVDFMPHTYSRTSRLLREFALCFTAADEVVLNDIYASAREQNTEGIQGEDLYNAVAGHHPGVKYFVSFQAAAAYFRSRLKPGDLFVTMGAGDNWKIGREVYRFFQQA